MGFHCKHSVTALPFTIHSGVSQASPLQKQGPIEAVQASPIAHTKTASSAQCQNKKQSAVPTPLPVQGHLQPAIVAKA